LKPGTWLDGNGTKMRIYISSSWKNRERVRALAMELRRGGHEVYDFTDPNCRSVPEIPPERFPEQFDPEEHIYREYINSVPYWRQAVEGNQQALNWCDAVVLLLPCGNDGHSDWAYGVGRGKLNVVVGQPKAGDRTPTHMWSDEILDSDDEVAAYFGNLHSTVQRLSTCCSAKKIK